MDQYKLGPITLSLEIASISDDYRKLFGASSQPLSEQAFRAAAYFEIEPKPIVLSEWFLWNDHSRQAMRWRKMRQVRKLAHATR